MSVNYESNLDKVKAALKEKELTALNLIGELIEGAAKLLAPSKNGQLRQSVEHKVFVDGSDKGVAIGTDMEYGIYVEKGTGIYAKDGNGRKDPWVYYDPVSGQYYTTNGQHPQPFLEPAATGQADKIKNIVEKVLSELDND